MSYDSRSGSLRRCSRGTESSLARNHQLPRNRRCFAAAAGAISFLLAGALEVHAQTWNNPAGGDWNINTNWSPQTVPTSSSVAAFEYPGNSYAVNVSAPATASAIDFDNLNPSLSVTLNLNSSLSVGSLDILPSSSDHGTWNLEGAGTLSASGDLEVGINGGTGTFVQSGATLDVANIDLTSGMYRGYGSYQISGGTLAVTGSETLSGGGNFFTQSGGSQSFGTLSITDAYGQSRYTVSAGTAIGVNATFNTFFLSELTVDGGSLKLSGSLQVNASTGVEGPAVLLASGTLDVNTYACSTASAALNWAGGNLFINNSLQFGSSPFASGLTIPKGGLLGGNGTISNPVTVSSGGTLSPGDGGPGILTLAPDSGGGTLSAGSSFVAQINGTTAGSLSTNYSQLRYAPQALPAVAAPLLTLGGNLIFELGYAPSVGDSYTLISDQSGTLAITGTFTGLPEGAIFSAAFDGMSNNFQITYAGNGGDDVVVTDVPYAPEPVLSLPCLACVSIMARRRARATRARP